MTFNVSDPRKDGSVKYNSEFCTRNYLSIPYFVILSSFIVYLQRVMTMGKLGTGIDRESPKALSLHVK